MMTTLTTNKRRNALASTTNNQWRINVRDVMTRGMTHINMA